MNALFDKLDMVMIHNKIIIEILNAMDKKPASKFIDQNSTEYKNKKHVYLNKLNDKDIKEPKPSTMAFYQIDYDEDTAVYS